MTDPNLRVMLDASDAATARGFDATNSPLTEPDPREVDLIFDRINAHFIAGTPEAVSDDDLRALVRIYRAQAERWATEEREKSSKPRTPRAKKPLGEALDLDL